MNEKTKINKIVRKIVTENRETANILATTRQNKKFNHEFDMKKKE
jgi:hypothetical protein